MQSHSPVDRVAARAAALTEPAIEWLSHYLTFPAISCDPAHAADVRELAQRICADLEALGMHHARLLSLDGALPAVAAEWLEAGPDKPTILIYGHMDLQPVKGEVWRTPPHTATRVGDRLYARGAADDMGGWVSHIAALRAWKEETGSFPTNIKLLIEGEEEIGSPNLERYMDAFPEAFSSDVMILTDCENPSTEIPGLTISLRGLLECTITVRALEADIHSGLWGGMVPDVSLALMQLVGRLVDEDGRVRSPRAVVPEEWRDAAWDVPLDTATIRSGAHLLPGVDPLPPRGSAPAEHLWRHPAVTVVATTLPTRERKKNALRAEAEAILSVRVGPGQDDGEIKAIFNDLLLKNPPGGVQVSVTWTDKASGAWLYTPRGPAFAAADRAYARAWGRAPLRIGVGGSIPFVALFGRRFGDLPLILNGVIDPETTAHGPNESLHLGIFAKTIQANVYLYDELSRELSLAR
jgi:cysteinylglycine-S-conjugate dipeptidase